MINHFVKLEIVAQQTFADAFVDNSLCSKQKSYVEFFFRYGRKLILLVTTIGSILCGVGVGLTPWFELFVVLRFLTAAFTHGGYLIMFVYGK